MSLNVGELFVNLGVKGSEKTVGALGGVKKGMGDAASASLETKAAIIGAFYALQQFTNASNKMGTGLINNSILLGETTNAIQEYNYAMRQAGVLNVGVEGTFRSIQKAMTDTLFNGGAPEGLAWIAQHTKGGAIGKEQAADYQAHPEKFLLRLQEYAQNEKNIGLRNKVLGSIVGDDMIIALTKNAFTPEVLSKAPKYSPGEVKALNQNDIMWANLFAKINMSVGRFNAKHGGSMVKDVDAVTTALLKLADALITVADKFKLFKWLSVGLESLSVAIQGGPFTEEGQKAGEAMVKSHGWPMGNQMKATVSPELEAMMEANSRHHRIAPKVLAPTESYVTTVHQNISHHGDAKDTKAVKDLHKQAATAAQVQHSYRTRQQGKSK